MFTGIVRNNSLVGGRAQAEARTPATERVVLYCTWRPSALTTGPHELVTLAYSFSKFLAPLAAKLGVSDLKKL